MSEKYEIKLEKFKVDIQNEFTVKESLFASNLETVILEYDNNLQKLNDQIQKLRNLKSEVSLEMMLKVRNDCRESKTRTVEIMNCKAEKIRKSCNADLEVEKSNTRASEQ